MRMKPPRTAAIIIITTLEVSVCDFIYTNLYKADNPNENFQLRCIWFLINIITMINWHTSGYSGFAYMKRL